MDRNRSRIEFRADQTKRLVLGLDAVRFSIAICNRLYVDIWSRLRQFEVREPLSAPTLEAVAVAADAWSIVDAAFRLRKVLQELPGLSKKEPPVKSFLEFTASLEELRHYYQHLERELKKENSSATPLTGHVS